MGIEIATSFDIWSPIIMDNSDINGTKILITKDLYFRSLNAWVALAIIIIETEKGIAIALQINTVLNNSVDENKLIASHLEKTINIMDINKDKIIPIFMDELIIPLISSFLLIQSLILFSFVHSAK